MNFIPCFLFVAMAFGVSVFFNGSKGSSGGSGGGASPSVGYSNSASTSGNTGNYSLPSGSPSAGKLVFVVISDTNSPSVPVVSGGASWTQATGSTTGRGLWYKVAGGSEPANYTITYAGGSKSDCSCAGVVWIINGATLDAIQSASSTSISPSATSTYANALGVVFAASNSASSPSKPSGYSANVTIASVSVDAGVGSKQQVGTGTISPGSWGASQARLWTAVVKA